MSRRLVLLLCLFAAVAGLAVWRFVAARTPRARIEAEADRAARRFIRLRDAEAEADRTVWAATAPAARIEAALAARVESAMASDDLGEFAGSVDPEAKLSQGFRLRWMTAELLSAVPARAGQIEAKVRVEAVMTNAAGNLRARRFEASMRWEDGAVPKGAVTGVTAVAEFRSPRRDFEPWADLVIPTNGAGLFIDPLLFLRDGVEARLQLAGAGMAAVLRRRAWVTEPMDAGPAEPVTAAAYFDADGDGVPELAVADAAGLRVRKGGAWVRVWSAPAKLRHPQSITSGDMDGDGDLDVWLTQYKAPYAGGQFPTPYHDADDGFPSFLLRNDGGRFVDVTDSAGLGTRRRRRTYSASWIDLDADGDADLVNVSDFAGVDVRLNDGRGRFSDGGAGLGETRHLFGMAHAFLDTNGDAYPELLAIGMDSPVASQLEALGLGREGVGLHTTRRAAMTFGNRLFTGPVGREPASSSPGAADLRRAGWAWGVAVFDRDNDGRDDVYVANGHETFASRVDFERQFWLHDIYAGSSTNDPAVKLYFAQANERRRAAGLSYGGWQPNRLFMATPDGGYEERAWTAGVAVTEDCRNVVAGDFDDDGRVDLAVTTYEQWPVVRQRLLIFRNVGTTGAWIGYRFGADAVGTRVELETGAGTRRRWIVDGDSYRSQSANEVHFGLGAGAAPLRATWVKRDGSRAALPVLPGRWHRVP